MNKAQTKNRSATNSNMLSILVLSLLLIPVFAFIWIHWADWFGNIPGKSALNQNGTISYPTHLAPRGETADFYLKSDGGLEKVQDPYRDLEDPESSATQQWVLAQRQLTDEFLSTCEVRDKFKQQMERCFNFPRSGLVSKHGDYYYFSHNSGLQDQSVIYRIREKNSWQIDQEQPLVHSEVFLDPNSLSDEGIVSLGTTAWSKDGSLFAYATKLGGSDWSTIHIIDTRQGKQVLEDEIKWVKFSSIAWNHDNSGFFYSRFDVPDGGDLDQAAQSTQKLEFQKVYYHEVGTAQSQDTLVHQNKDEKDWMFIPQVTNDGKYIIIYTSKNTDDIALISVANLFDGINKKEIKELQFEAVVPEWIGGFRYVHNYGSSFIFKTNYEAPMGRVISIDINASEIEHWVELIPQNKIQPLQDSICSNGLIINIYLKNAHESMQVYTINDPTAKAELLRELDLPGMGSIADISAKHNSAELFYSFTSFTVPNRGYHVDMETFTQTRYNTIRLPEGCPNPEDFTTDQIWYESKDGTSVPMYIVRKTQTLPDIKIKPQKPLPTLLYAYGGFGISTTPHFSISSLLFMNQMNGILAVANIRGGGEFGEDWHKVSVLDKKQNGFDDFIAAAEFLHNKQLTDNKNLFIRGGSNGGLLVTAVANQRQELFAGVIGQVPVTDMLRFQNFTIGYAWTSEYGSSDNGDFDFLIKYSPLHTISPRKYPAILITTADHDDRVVPLHTYKYIATLQEVAGSVPGQNPLLARIEINAGHGGGMPTIKAIQEIADVYGFMAKIVESDWEETKDES